MRRVATAMLVLLVTGSASAGTAIAARRVAAEAGGARLQAARERPGARGLRTRTSTRGVRASRGGRFTVTFQGFAFPSCEANGYGGLYALLETLPDGAMKVAAVATLREALDGAVETGE